MPMRRLPSSVLGASGCLSHHLVRHSTSRSSPPSSTTPTAAKAAATTSRESAGKASGGGGQEDDGDIVTPWTVIAKGPQGINYDRVLTTFKAERVDAAARQHIRDVIATCHVRATASVSANDEAEKAAATGNGKTSSAGPTTTAASSGPASASASSPSPPPALHHFFTRDIAFSHRDLHKALKDIEATSEPGNHSAFLYTGRGPSAGSMHVGHVLPFLLTKYLQDVFHLPLVVQITDDEKYLFRDVPFEGERADENIRSNIKDIIAFGFNPRHTFIFRNTQYMGEMYTTVLPLQRSMTANAVKHTLGIVDSDNVGKFSFPATQAAPCFSSAFRRVLQNGGKPMRCLIPCAIDQDPFFVLTRASAARLKQPPPALLHTKFLPALKGLEHKMSSSAEENGVITLHDTDKQVRKKMRKAFSGGSGTLAQMQAKGANLEVDVAYQYLRFFCPDDAVFDEVTEKYSSGAMNSGEVKDLAAECIMQNVLRDWRARRAKVTDADLVHFCSIRNILF
ncbi:putative mitochondrial tryptophanyl-tRNA synthetase [Leptomonas pyrrhocoris]|uniref:tryptophan--tRNA ligase n=1 Tax=Leptomonas pyrrhocoris TaxID=157538 RepID=A0A0M9G7Q5_LEPPY|nr:putative mitochondrial tryptophanyl-tRNA synthetase [Leptomonas pyrrhocoris]XP_015662545.1 putative mitochondrial tryptophanyl-tRNA synthetase [Leptomonas pyrrhocoris]KPA84105.1 putative mitochondrial tryptophanyl-tRNA synthetase [Leptomonas pyrrhocoris]KPA84106.1 putative mitochondrial tryptophanyl-tRNA synthetase [Leptomonas pyrrhocoris]|eukprot:XP_015662544.1 putative mitochondrial tryptophanyl-tRNA synthetase [Leptomonas pyrrhocoris]